MRLFHQTERYSLHENGMGHISLTRKEDNANAYFQAEEDVSLWDRNLMVFEGYMEREGRKVAEDYFNRLCATYDEMLDGELDLHGPCDHMGRPLQDSSAQ
jgi:hypothetical protein